MINMGPGLAADSA